MSSLGGGNRDPDYFDHPNRFDLDRDQPHLLTFGFGPHHCLGMHLAKAELEANVDAVCDFVPTQAQIRAELMQFATLYIPASGYVSDRIRH